MPDFAKGPLAFTDAHPSKSGAQEVDVAMGGGASASHVVNCIFDRRDCVRTAAYPGLLFNERYGACVTFGAAFDYKDYFTVLLHELIPSM